MPRGRPKPNQLSTTTSMPCRTRSSRATMSIICGCPPWLLKITILRMPARWTDSPMSSHKLVSVWALSDSVPGKAVCSSDFPIGCIGSTVSGSAGSASSSARFRIPWLMCMSTEHGRCGPCCSMADTGRMAIGSTPESFIMRKSSVVISYHILSGSFSPSPFVMWWRAGEDCCPCLDDAGSCPSDASPSSPSPSSRKHAAESLHTGPCWLSRMDHRRRRGQPPPLAPAAAR
mmetsp:Transcript_9877/g.25136  ORF Transcript_9877/g.25136 Transcript_9877/m.25136 type:complete len:231 (-) Transcript_9877:202-894(-)